MATITSGTSAMGTPSCCARSTRKASLKRASVNSAPRATTPRYAGPSRRSASRRSGWLRTAPERCGGSCKPKPSSATASRPGITATQKTARKSSAQSSIRPLASSGPAKAPTVSSAWRKPKAAPRWAGGVMSATSASRGAPRMPLPMRSTKRAATTAPSPVARANTGLVKAPRA